MTDVGEVGSGPAWAGQDSEMRQDSSTASGSSRRLSLNYECKNACQNPRWIVLSISLFFSFCQNEAAVSFDQNENRGSLEQLSPSFCDFSNYKCTRKKKNHIFGLKFWSHTSASRPPDLKVRSHMYNFWSVCRKLTLTEHGDYVSASAYC